MTKGNPWWLKNPSQLFDIVHQGGNFANPIGRMTLKQAEAHVREHNIAIIPGEDSILAESDEGGAVYYEEDAWHEA
jgi:hypothetical protein